MRDRLIELIKQAKKQTKNANCDIERNMILAEFLNKEEAELIADYLKGGEG